MPHSLPILDQRETITKALKAPDGKRNAKTPRRQDAARRSRNQRGLDKLMSNLLHPFHFTADTPQARGRPRNVPRTITRTSRVNQNRVAMRTDHRGTARRKRMKNLRSSGLSRETRSEIPPAFSSPSVSLCLCGAHRSSTEPSDFQGADEDLDPMLASFIGEAIPPDVELVFHSDSETGSWTQLDSRASCSLSRAGVRYLRRLPRGKASLGSWATSLRPRISPSSTRHSTWSLGLRPTASQMDPGRVIRRFLSMMVALTEGLSLGNAAASNYTSCRWSKCPSLRGRIPATRSDVQSGVVRTPRRITGRAS